MLNYSSSDYIVDALQMGFEVAPLAINSIPYHDKIAQKKIDLGLKAIKACQEIFLTGSSENRPSSSVEDFVTRLLRITRNCTLLTPLVELGLLMNLRQESPENLSEPTKLICLCCEG